MILIGTWKGISGWEDLYEVNDCGDVRSKITGYLIKGDVNSAGYERVCLYNINHRPKKQRFFRHRLVAEHYIPNPTNLPEVNHIDGDITNNDVDNLEWCTKEWNERHSHLYGRKLNRSYTVEYKDGRVVDYISSGELAEELGITRRSVINWLKRLNRGYKKYDIRQIYYKNSA